MGKSMLTISGMAEFPHVHLPNAWGKYSITVFVDKETETTLKDLGLRPTTRKGETAVSEDGRKGFTFSTNATEDGGAPLVVDSAGKPTKVLIGNGSTVNVSMSVGFNKAFSKAYGILRGVQILKLVEYVPTKTEAPKFEKIEGGFTTNDELEAKGLAATEAELARRAASAASDSESEDDSPHDDNVL